MYRIYSDSVLQSPSAGDTILVEDSHAGYEFFSALAGKKAIPCFSSDGAGNLFEMLQNIDKIQRKIVIADGATFGPQIKRIYECIHRQQNITLYLPESFEWILLSSGLLEDKELRQILAKPQDYIESRLYFSWERYFTALLTEKTQGTYLSYSKSHCNPVFLQTRELSQIVSSLPEVLQNILSSES